MNFDTVHTSCVVIEGEEKQFEQFSQRISREFSCADVKGNSQRIECIRDSTAEDLLTIGVSNMLCAMRWQSIVTGDEKPTGDVGR